MYYKLYQFLSQFLFIAIFPFFLLHSAITGRNRTGLGQRFGFIKSQLAAGNGKKHRIWLHAASVGEVQVARALIDELKNLLPEAALILSTVNAQGYIVARNQLGTDIPCIFAPLDLPFAVSRALTAIKPTLYVCLETELWPSLLMQARKSGCRLLLLNGRLSDRAFKKYLHCKGFSTEMLSVFSRIATIGQADADRFIALGASPEQVVVSGNAKYDLCVAASTTVPHEDYRRWLNLEPGQRVFIAGSTHTGEEKLILDVFRRLKPELPDLIWIIAPRILRRLPEVEALLARENIVFERFSLLKSRPRSLDVILVDTMGELAGLYSQATFVFCGGSLVPRGGHNIMEAAAWGKPVFYGPSMKDFLDAKELLESSNAGGSVRSADELHDRILALAKDPEAYREMAGRAQAAAQTQTGSARRQAQLIKDVLFS